MIIVKDLKKNYRKKCALKGVSFSVSQGVTGVLGPNGSGKTTLFRIWRESSDNRAGRFIFGIKTAWRYRRKIFVSGTFHRRSD